MSAVGLGMGFPAHPRACGENKEATKTAFILPGSSPRVRGKPIRIRPAGAKHGLIPARAGKTG